MSIPVYPLSATLHPRRLLVRGVNWLGDAVMTTPALLRLREALPDTHITLLTHEKLAGLWLGHPAVDEVITFAAKEGVFSLARRLRAGRFDTALALPNSTRTGLEVRLAGIPRRIGYAGGGRSWLLTQAVPRRAGVVEMRKRTAEEVRRLVGGSARGGPETGASAASHHLFHYLHLAAALGAKPELLAPVIAVSAEELAAVKAKFNLPAGLLIGLNAGAEYGPAKRWPAERFIATAKELQARLHCGFIIFGGLADKALATQIAEALGAERAVSGQRSAVSVVNLAGQTSLRELCAALRACRVVLTNDTGPMHLAAAVGARVVGLFGSTSPELTGPGLPGDGRHIFLRGDAPCAPCFLRECPVDFRCMNSLAVAAVADAVGRLAGED
ncbi:MAG: lipopolysaccharide heptosyltransferase II [Pedosphaera sp. Tous-C6FEB]|nr:MAG: lipopolysaccharide heptosyltransferase II [Pedosphaera sp. Tous-C6FEB]